ncbi:MAG: hypothetical protein KatS3mg115_2142 [Candidatus Poribacteria bacterium]|nr:MAG: hypothetical protein KatS3mg115_2142 [Candidatus Poribacteria bacterium]
MTGTVRACSPARTTRKKVPIALPVSFANLFGEQPLPLDDRFIGKGGAVGSVGHGEKRASGTAPWRSTIASAAGTHPLDRLPNLNLHPSVPRRPGAASPFPRGRKRRLGESSRGKRRKRRALREDGNPNGHLGQGRLAPERFEGTASGRGVGQPQQSAVPGPPPERGSTGRRWGCPRRSPFPIETDGQNGHGATALQPHGRRRWWSAVGRAPS